MTFSDNIIAALIAVGGSALIGASGWLAGRRLKREGVTERNLGIQLQGWKDFAESLRHRITELEERIEECEQDRNKLWIELRNLRDGGT